MARHELQLADQYEHQVVNVTVPQAVDEICDILAQSRFDTMIDALKEEEIVNKVGGRFKLSTLIQKRLAAINAGARPLVDVKSDDKMEIVVQEILQDKIYLDASNQVKITGEVRDVGGPPEFDLSAL